MVMVKKTAKSKFMVQKSKNVRLVVALILGCCNKVGSHGINLFRVAGAAWVNKRFRC